jgi:hypothetical protein
LGERPGQDGKMARFFRIALVGVFTNKMSMNSQEQDGKMARFFSRALVGVITTKSRMKKTM